MDRRQFLTFGGAGIATAVAGGCTMRDSKKASVFEGSKEVKNEWLTLIDVSDSFLKKVTDQDGRAFEFMKAVCEEFGRYSVGKEDHLMIGKLAGNDHAVIWGGTPRSLRRDFPTPEKFRRFLLTHSDRNGSAIHAGMNQALRYVMRRPGVKDGKVRVVTLVLSDMEDTAGREPAQALLGTLEQYAEMDGAIGIYYCKDSLLERWDGVLQKAGIRDYHVESEFEGRPILPRRV